MKNTEIAIIFHNIAGLLQHKRENPLKVCTYQKVVRSIEQLPIEMEQLVAEDGLREISGVGVAIWKKIIKLVQTQKLIYCER